MDGEVDCSLSSNGQNLPQRSTLESLDLDGYLTMGKRTSLNLPTEPADLIIPGTPDSKQKVVEYADDFESSTSCIPRALNLGSENGDLSPHSQSPRTPRDNVFDPFAPGPDHLLLAPLCKKNDADSRTSVARTLKFKELSNFDLFMDHDIDVHTMSEEDMLETLYRMLLKLIISRHREDILAGISVPFCDSDGETTPTSVPLLTGVAESCPGAPRKTARKVINIDKGLCKKLEF